LSTSPSAHLSVSLDVPLLKDILHSEQLPQPSNALFYSQRAALKRITDVLFSPALAFRALTILSLPFVLYVVIRKVSLWGLWNTGDCSDTRTVEGESSVKNLPFLQAFFSDICYNLVHHYRLTMGTFRSVARSVAEAVVFYLPRFLSRRLVTIQSGDLGSPLKLTDGWGLCSLRDRRKLEGGFVKYTFALPEKNNVLGTSYGQRVELCVLHHGKVTRGRFYPLDVDQRGVLEVLVREGGNEKWEHEKEGDGEEKNIDGTLGLESRDSGDDPIFADALATLSLGDDVAISPSSDADALTYTVLDVPITDLVFLSNGVGIVPALSQAKAVVASVKSIAIVWVNRRESDFVKECYEKLEKLFYRFNRRVDVSCCLSIDEYSGETTSDVRKPLSLSNYPEVTEGVPDYRPGMWAVLSGPGGFTEEAHEYLLQGRGFPSGAVCILPP